MKKIKITESQLHKIFELNISLGSDSPSEVQEYPGSTVSTTANYEDADGNVRYGKPKITDKIQNDITNQNFLDGHRKW